MTNIIEAIEASIARRKSLEMAEELRQIEEKTANETARQKEDLYYREILSKCRKAIEQPEIYQLLQEINHNYLHNIGEIIPNYGDFPCGYATPGNPEDKYDTGGFVTVHPHHPQAGINLYYKGTKYEDGRDSLNHNEVGFLIAAITGHHAGLFVFAHHGYVPGEFPLCGERNLLDFKCPINRKPGEIVQHSDFLQYVGSFEFGDNRKLSKLVRKAQPYLVEKFVDLITSNSPFVKKASS